jgi:hypothetical protein
MKPRRFHWPAAVAAATALLLLGFFTTHAIAQCNDGACTTIGRPGGGGLFQSQRAIQPAKPALQYIERTGHYRAVVRIRGDERIGKRNYGSGVAVRWAGRVVVMTASHVVKGCRTVLIWLEKPKRWATADATKIDASWDVAFVTLSTADSSELTPAEIAWGDDATPEKGARLETCGFGPDGQFAVNTGTLVGYRGNGSGKWTDWIDVTGSARQGDSGGPVFDTKGQVVGVLWGTDQHTVTATQAGYIHVQLAANFGPWDGSNVAIASRGIAPNPEDAVGPSAEACDCPPGEVCLGKGLLNRRKAPPPAPPQVIVNSDPRVRDSLGHINGTLDKLAQNTAPKPVPPETEGVPTTAKILLVLGALVAGAFIFYVVQQN